MVKHPPPPTAAPLPLLFPLPSSSSPILVPLPLLPLPLSSSPLPSPPLRGHHDTPLLVSMVSTVWRTLEEECGHRDQDAEKGAGVVHLPKVPLVEEDMAATIAHIAQLQTATPSPLRT